MATKYATQQQGVADGAAFPAEKSDGREVNANRKVTLASKEAGVAWANGDTIYLGEVPVGSKITDIKVCAGASLGTSTIAIGTGGDPREGGAVDDATAYTDAKTMTVANVPTSIGPKAAKIDDAPASEPEHLYATIGTADIAAAALVTIAIELAGIS